MSFELLIQNDAWSDVRKAYDWYEDQKINLGVEFLEELEECYKRLIEDPKRYPYVNHIFRRIKTGRFPYLIVYKITDNKVIVMRIRHVKQKPL